MMSDFSLVFENSTPQRRDNSLLLEADLLKKG